MKHIEQRRQFRVTIEQAVKTATRPLSGKEIAQATGMPYKPVIDALQALCNSGRIYRTGKKKTAMWLATPAHNPGPLALQAAVFAMTRTHHHDQQPD